MIASILPSTVFAAQAQTDVTVGADFSNVSMPNAGVTGFIAPIDPIPSGADVVHISTAAQLAAIGGASSAGKYYVLDNDINLTAEWVPIDFFHGTFDGRGYSINNLYVLESSKRQYAGLFGNLIEYKSAITIKM